MAEPHHHVADRSVGCVSQKLVGRCAQRHACLLIVDFTLPKMAWARKSRRN
jgi:hypothetical protein